MYDRNVNPLKDFEEKGYCVCVVMPWTENTLRHFSDLKDNKKSTLLDLGIVKMVQKSRFQKRLVQPLLSCTRGRLPNQSNVFFLQKQINIAFAVRHI
jgi:hypothetical protein